MRIIDKLASSSNRRDELPNKELAKQIAEANDKHAVKEVMDNLNNKNKNIQSDCIKVIDEIGKLKPQLVAGFSEELLKLLDSKNNRLQWGAMIALNTITNETPQTIYEALGKIIEAADRGSVITNDHCVSILIKLCAVEEYKEDSFSLLIERLKMSPENQLPTYAESALPIISEKNKSAFINVLKARLPGIEKQTKRLRLEKLLTKLH